MSDSSIARSASCSCGALQLHVNGDPVRVSVCHCLACQQRTGSVFGAQARFARDRVTQPPCDQARQYVRKGDSGGTATFTFCSACGATVHWHLDGLPDFIMIAVGAFADPSFPKPTFSIYEDRRHAWAQVPAGDDVEHWD